MLKKLLKSSKFVERRSFMRASLSEQILRKRVHYGPRLKPWIARRSVQLALDGCCAFVAIMCAYALRFEMSLPPWALLQMLVMAVVMSFLGPLALSTFGGYRATWQHFGIRDLGHLARRFGTLNLLLMLVPLVTTGRRLIPYSIIVMDFLLVTLLCASIRMVRRLDHEALRRLSAKDRILVIGTSDTIAAAIRQLGPLYGTGIFGAVTDDELLLGRRILGVPVLGNTLSIGSLIRSHGITLIFLCTGDLERMPQLIQIAADMDVAVKFLPSIHDLLDNRVRVSRNVTVATLRKQTEMKVSLHEDITTCLNDRVVLITGAGGSIGSEIARQAVRAQVRKLILLDQDENAMFELMSELGNKAFLQPVIADIRDREALRNVFARERPHIVLHAAAYKHVPMMEANPCEAVLNNVFGTQALAEVATEFTAERLVMISSDKAVRPSSVMGATKRLAEVVIQQIAKGTDSGIGRTQFACVRFGNVLGSRGSVLPMFLKQIEQGGPVTVTHDQMTRYFMTIPQAVNLVLHAATLASCGDVYMLDMGDPVRIMDFARDVIQSSGLTPGRDIEIKIVGSRPGEKLHEQLWSEDALVTATELKQIYRVHAEVPDSSFPRLLQELERCARNHQADRVRELLSELPIDYLTERIAPLVA